VGASNSAKDGKFYFVDLAHSKQIAERFQHWPEAAMVYFAILVSDCKLMVDEPNLRVAVVQEHALGTNDCRGWVRESVYRSSRSAPTGSASSGWRSMRMNRSRQKAHSRR